MTEFCRQLGCPSEILQAIGDLKCSTCAENQDPKIARPSSIHDHGDFGDVVAIDGITWTNKMGQQYNIYHMLDQSTCITLPWLLVHMMLNRPYMRFTRGGFNGPDLQVYYAWMQGQN